MNLFFLKYQKVIKSLALMVFLLSLVGGYQNCTKAGESLVVGSKPKDSSGSDDEVDCSADPSDPSCTSGATCDAPQGVCDVYSDGTAEGLSWNSQIPFWVFAKGNPQLIYWGPTDTVYLKKPDGSFKALTQAEYTYLTGINHALPPEWGPFVSGPSDIVSEYTSGVAMGLSWNGQYWINATGQPDLIYRSSDDTVYAHKAGLFLALTKEQYTYLVADQHHGPEIYY